MLWLPLLGRRAGGGRGGRVGVEDGLPGEGPPACAVGVAAPGGVWWWGGAVGWRLWCLCLALGVLLLILPELLPLLLLLLAAGKLVS